MAGCLLICVRVGRDSCLCTGPDSPEKQKAESVPVRTYHTGTMNRIREGRERERWRNKNVDSELRYNYFWIKADTIYDG